MADFIITDYTIENGLLRAKFIYEGEALRVVVLKNIKKGIGYEHVKCEKADGDSDFTHYFEVDLCDEKLIKGTWYPVILCENGECFFKYCDRINEKNVGVMIELSDSRLYFDADKKIHYMGALDKESNFIIRKWSQNIAGIKKRTTIVKKCVVDENKVTFTLAKKLNEKVSEAQVWIWRRSLKTAERLNAVLSDDRKKFTVDFSHMLELSKDEIGKVWSVFFVYNMDGTYIQNRIEIRKANGNRKEYTKGICVDESERFLITQLITDSDGVCESAAQIYFDKVSRLCYKVVQRNIMYRDMYHVAGTDYSVKNGKLKLWFDFSYDRFENTRLLLRHFSEMTNEMSEYYFEKTDNCFEIDCEKIKWESLRYEIIFQADEEGYTYDFCVIPASDTIKKKIAQMYKDLYSTKENDLAYMTETLSGKMVIECRKKNKYDALKYRINEKVAMQLMPIARRMCKDKKYLMFYEKFCTAAQDNSFYMFEYYVKKNREDIAARYVLEKEQKEYKELKKKYGKKIVPFMSVRHLICIQLAKAFISTDSKRHCYRWRCANTPIKKMLEKKKFVFLQHGVIGFKRVDYIYGKQFANRADLFVTCSEFERDIVERFFGYSKKEIIITGMARWDKLKNKVSEKPMIFYMPTWRNWIMETDREEFVRTEYYKKYTQILNDDRLSDILKEKDVELVFCLHPKFREFSSEIRSKCDKIKIIDFADCHINELLMRCNMFITDYSSASWDVLYLGKPVLFYQFDADAYNEKQGSYIKLDNDLFGYRVTEFDDFVEKIAQIIENGFADNERSEVLREKYLPLRDNKNRERIYKCVRKKLGI